MPHTDLRPGQRVTVTVRGRAREAIVRKVPPFEDAIPGGGGETETVTDGVLVQYPGTSIDDGNFFADITEVVDLEDVDA